MKEVIYIGKRGARVLTSKNRLIGECLKRHRRVPDFVSIYDTRFGRYEEFRKGAYFGGGQLFGWIFPNDQHLLLESPSFKFWVATFGDKIKEQMARMMKGEKILEAEKIGGLQLRLAAPVKPVESECAESPDGKHRFSVDLVYDSTGQTKNCEFCGEPQEEP